MTQTVPASIDLNADVAESFGAQFIGDDEPLFAHVTSANVACGFHAGDPTVIAATIKAALKHNVELGAHPSYPDRGGFGRETMKIARDELCYGIIYQIGAVAAIVHSMGGRLVHVKPHGALYNDAAKDPSLAATVAEAIAAFDPSLVLVGLAGSALLSAGSAAGLTVAAEAFCDRAYEDDGSLRSRTLANAVLLAEEKVVAQALDIVTKNTVRTSSGRVLPLQAQTLCIHGDTPEAVKIARAVRTALAGAGVKIQPLVESLR